MYIHIRASVQCYWKRVLTTGLALAVWGQCAIALAQSLSLGTPSETRTDLTNTAVARFLVDIDGLESEFPDEAKAKGLVPLVVHGKQTVRTAREAAETLRNPEGSLVKIAFDSMYAVVATEITRAGLNLLPVDTLRGTVPYLIGYPFGKATSVVEQGRHPYALEVEFDVTVPDQGTGYFAIVGTGKSKTKGRPEMYMRMRLVGPDGLVWKEKVRVRSKAKVELGERWILGVRTRTEVSDASTLPDMTREAMRRLVAKRVST